MDSELQATPRIDGIEYDLVVQVVFGWPEGWVGPPINGKGGLAQIKRVEDKRGSAEVVGRTDNLG